MSKGASTTVTFNNSVSKYNLSLELDSVLNADATSFSHKSNVYLALYGRPSDGTAAIKLSEGSGYVYQTKIPRVVTEVITVENSNQVSAKNRIDGSFTAKLLGRIPMAGAGAPSITAEIGTTNIVLSVKSYATIEISYTTNVDILCVNKNTTTASKVLVLGTSTSTKSGVVTSNMLTIDYTEGSTYEVTLIVKDFCTEKIIPNALVKITSTTGFTFNGKSDVNGKVSLGVLDAGDYVVTTTATGYESSDTDLIANDKFTV